MSYQADSLVIEKMKTLGIDFYEASNGVGLVLTPDEKLEVGAPGSKLVDKKEAAAAVIEFLKK
jgi:hypothetical protein